MSEERVYTFRPPYLPDFKDGVLSELRKKLDLNSDAPLDEVKLIDEDVHYFADSFIDYCDVYDKAVERQEQQNQLRGGDSVPDVEKWDEEELKVVWAKYNDTQYAKTRIFLCHFLKVRDGVIE